MSASGLKVALTGMGGYGEIYLKELLRGPMHNGMKLMGAIDPAPSRCRLLSQVQAQGIPIYPSMEDFFAEATADLVVLSTPPQLHCEQVCLALSHGCHVLCEKPIGAEPSQVQMMIDARDRAGKIVGIGYQWSFSPAIQQLKRDVAAGRFGAPKAFRTSIFWPRDEHYYRRNRWAGRQRDDQGRPVLDSPVNNACAHYLHNMFYVLGEKLDESEQPSSVVAELYRANEIDNYDTGALKCVSASGAEMLFIATHATRTQQDPLFRYEFENAAIYHGGEVGMDIVARNGDGVIMNYGEPVHGASTAKLREVASAIRDGKRVACGLEAAASQTFCMYAAQQSCAQIIDFPLELVVSEGEPGDRKTYVKGLETELTRCYNQFKLPSELGISWAKPGRRIHVASDPRPLAADPLPS